MKVENAVALQFILQDDLYLLKNDKIQYETKNLPGPADVETKNSIPESIKIEPKAINALELADPLPLKFNYLGKNQKSFLVLVHYTTTDFIDDAHLIALTNIIKRKELVIDDLAIVNMAGYTEVRYEELLKFFKPAKLLVLGKAALPVGIPELAINASVKLNEVNALYSFGFTEMMDSNDNKKAFWEQMKGL